MNNYDKTPKFEVTPTLTNEHSGIGEVAIPILAISDAGTSVASGTAAVVGPWLAITAWHVVADFIERFGAVYGKSGIEPGFQLITMLTLAKNHGVMPLRVGKIWASPRVDIAFLELLPASENTIDHKWKYAPLDLIPPKIGDCVSAFGYARSTIEEIVVDGPIPRWQTSPCTSVGEVVEVHAAQRDSVQLRFPCFRTTMRLEGGMSGGPLFNDEGLICGIACSSFDMEDASEEHISYASLIWPTMGIFLEVDFGDLPEDSRCLAYQLAKIGRLSVRGLEYVSIITDAQGEPCTTLSNAYLATR